MPIKQIVKEIGLSKLALLKTPFYATFAPLKIVMMNNRRAFEIAFVGLKPGIHGFQYGIDDKFFAQYDEQDFNNVDAHINLTLDKQNGFILLKFDIDGTANAACDRCGNPLTIKLWDEFNIVVKMVEEPEKMNAGEDDPDVYYISKTESHLQVADWIYEFINLSIPLQKRCPDDATGKSTCNPEVLKKLEQMENNTNSGTNPLWKGLEQFKNLQ